MTERPIRTIHHLASSGGTIISRCLAAMPSVVLLSEVHPLEVRPNVFNPYDPLQEFLGRYGGLAMSEADVAAVFSERIRLIAERCEQEDRTLVLRDHSHADFFMGAPYGPRLLASLRDVRPVKSVVTVRDPLDMFLSMRASGFIPAETDFETVCGHYLAFLDTYAKVTCFRYEDFARDPDAWLAEFCGHLAIPYDDAYRDRFASVRLTGDSGRGRSLSGIGEVPRRPIPSDDLPGVFSSPTYRVLCERLDYRPFEDA